MPRDFEKGNKGKPKGAQNKATREIKEICRGHGPEMVDALVRLAKAGESDAVRVSAIKEILDRGYGKAPQHVSVENDLSKMTGEQLARELAAAAAELRSLGINPALLAGEASDTESSGSRLTH